MNKRVSGFIAGVFTTAIVGSLGLSALAATGRMTISVDPINIQVNGQTFKPTDAKGTEVPVFAYNGTTYAPLRALAEAYGLEVGYDAAANMATVNDPGSTPSTPDTTAPSTDYSSWSKEEEAVYQEFKGMWERDTENNWDGKIYSGGIGVELVCTNVDKISAFLTGKTTDEVRKYSERNSLEYAKVYFEDHDSVTVNYSFQKSSGWTDTCYPVAILIGGELKQVTSGYVSTIMPAQS